MDQFFRPFRAYAVVGASTNPQKFGFKVFKWYKDHNISAIPVNPKGETVLQTPSIKSIRDLNLPKGHDLGISVITPPDVSKELIKSLNELKLPIHSVWFQPGSHTPEVLELAKHSVPNVIADCILVNGDKYLAMSRL